jgi:hypothetical protein
VRTGGLAGEIALVGTLECDWTLNNVRVAVGACCFGGNVGLTIRFCL